jgi:hypothetical protein
MRSATSNCNRTAPVTRGSESIKDALIDEIIKGMSLIERLDDLAFRRSSDNSASVGEQFRHNLDFLNTFLNGVSVGRIDYALRERDVRAERDRRYAVERFRAALDRVSRLTSAQVGALVSVRSEIDPDLWLASSVGREMEFVLSHTVHHHALIAEKLIDKGVEVDASLGVARSTQNYRSRLAA